MPGRRRYRREFPQPFSRASRRLSLDTCIRPTEMHGVHDQNDERRERTRVPTPSPAWPLRARHRWVFKNGASFFPRFSTSGCERASFFFLNSASQRRRLFHACALKARSLVPSLLNCQKRASDLPLLLFRIPRLRRRRRVFDEKGRERKKRPSLLFPSLSVSLDSQTDWIKNDRELHVRRKEDRRKKLGKQKE